MTQHGDMSATQCIQVSEEGFLGSTYTKTCPTECTSVVQGLFFGGSGRRASAHMRLAFSIMPTDPSAFPLLGMPQAPGNKPNPLKGVKAWVDGPVKLEEISSC